jgi:hypothetical protein
MSHGKVRQAVRIDPLDFAALPCFQSVVSRPKHSCCRVMYLDVRTNGDPAEEDQ